MTELLLRETLGRLADNRQTIKLWLRDDDAVNPSTALDTLLTMTASYAVPVTLAVIPEHTGEALAKRLDTAPDALVAVHGWSHANHAPDGEKKQELGPSRPAELVLAELKAGLRKLKDLHAHRFIPMLVPPWNRIAAGLASRLGEQGFTSLSVFGREQPSSPICLINTHVDIMDWHGTRGGRPAPVLFAELATEIGRVDPAPLTGILTHHLVHDAAAWDFLEALFAITNGHPACEWVRPEPS
ncbi:polysaccharide deacetylase [Rhizobium sp. CG5]|uniref:polysaccharide deacetylase family protein n=1 Tax=Rhizobium sp. CG5 TaxID=2726076 RepID=UPI00203368AB|nr:polysaccharide deacetylase family protein [Rhizobium sp. CG5]MCM2475453.1 polysaccharide deacetylase [Rhizobium sp. CG5]